MSELVLEVENLTKGFPVKRGLTLRTKGHIKAVDDVSFEVYRGETLGLVGESGCGKSTLARSILRLVEPTSGRVKFKGIDFLGAEGRDLLAMRKRMQIVFQIGRASCRERV